MGRTELLRACGKPYRQMEAEGVMLPVREAHVEYLGRAQYDDLLRLAPRCRKSAGRRSASTWRSNMPGRGMVCRGWTVHVVTNHDGRPIRPGLVCRVSIRVNARGALKIARGTRLGEAFSRQLSAVKTGGVSPGRISTAV